MKYEFDHYEIDETFGIVVKDAISQKDICRFTGKDKVAVELNFIAAFIVLSDFTGKSELKDIAYNYIQSYDLPDCFK